jgi:hypothetical protein
MRKMKANSNISHGATRRAVGKTPIPSAKCQQQQRETTSRVRRRSLPIRKNAKSIYSRGPGARSILIAPCRILINCCCHHHCRRGKEIAQWIKNIQQQHQRGGGIFSSLRGSAYKDCAAGEGDSSSPIANKGECVLRKFFLVKMGNQRRENLILKAFQLPDIFALFNYLQDLSRRYKLTFNLAVKKMASIIVSKFI